MWASLRSDAANNFPEAPGKAENIAEYLTQVEEQYAQDAYHSLSIERYRVSPELIEKVRRGDWQPDNTRRTSRHTVPSQHVAIWKRLRR